MSAGTTELAEPTGSAFDFVSSTYGEDVVDPYPMFRELRETTPVMDGDILATFNVPSQADYSNTGRRVFTLFRHEDIRQVLADTKTYTARLLNDGQSVFWGEDTWTSEDGDDHRRMRTLLAPCFNPALMRRWSAEMIEPVVRDVYARPLVEARSCDLIADFGLRFPVRAIYSFLGFPDDPVGVEKFATWALRILGGAQRDPAKLAISGPLAFQAARDLYDHIKAIVATRRAEGAQGDDMISYLLRAEDQGVGLDDHKITSLIRLMLPAAAETTTRTFGNIMVILLERPELLGRVRADRSLVPALINEGMRYEATATFLARLVERDVVIGGCEIPAGSALSLATGSANRDEAVFKDGDSFDLDRPAKPNLAFGTGAHMCVGMAVARLELVAAFNAVFDLMPNIRLDPAKPKPQIRGMNLRGTEALHVIWD